MHSIPGIAGLGYFAPKGRIYYRDITMDLILNETCLLRTVIYNSRDAIICLLRLNKKTSLDEETMYSELQLCTVYSDYLQPWDAVHAMNPYTGRVDASTTRCHALT
nr:hypothetical protein Q903MT_gene801 [Picea sitchensis]